MFNLKKNKQNKQNKKEPFDFKTFRLFVDYNNGFTSTNFIMIKYKYLNKEFDTLFWEVRNNHSVLFYLPLQDTNKSYGEKIIVNITFSFYDTLQFLKELKEGKLNP